MSRYTCWVCGSGYDGVNCPVCAINKHAEENARHAAQDQERATAAMEAAVSEQTERLAEEMQRSREAAENAAFETQMAMAQAAEEQRAALAEAAEEHKRTTANAWKLQAQAKCEQAGSLYRSGLLAEALHLALEALKEDPSNINAYFVVGACYEAQGKSDEAHPFLIKQVQMLSMPEFQCWMRIHLKVLLAIGSDPVLVKVFCAIVRDNLPKWPPCDSVESAERFIHILIEKQDFQLAFLVEKWVLYTKGFAPDALDSARRIIYALKGSTGGIDSNRTEIEGIIQWLEDPKNRPRLSALSGGEGCISLLALAYSIEFASALGIKKDTIDSYFKNLQFARRGSFEAELRNLESVVNNSTIDRQSFSPEQVMSLKNILSRIKAAAKTKYESWEPELQSQIYDGAVYAVDGLPKRNLGCLAGFLWLILLFISGRILPIAMNKTNSSNQFVYAIGAVVGAILFGALSGYLVRSFQRYNRMREHLVALVSRHNKEFEQLGLPQVLAPKLRLRSPAVEFAVCVAAVIVLFAGWQWFILQSPGPTSLLVGTVSTCTNVDGPGLFQPRSTIKAGEPVCVYAVAVDVNQNGKIDCAFGITVKDDGGHIVTAQNGKLSVQASKPNGFYYWPKLDLGSGAHAGNYTAFVDVHDNLSGLNGSGSTQFTIVGNLPKVIGASSAALSTEDQREHQLVKQAQESFASQDYDAALKACNEALILNDGDQIAFQLRNQIESVVQQKATTTPTSALATGNTSPSHGRPDASPALTSTFDTASLRPQVPSREMSNRKLAAPVLLSPAEGAVFSNFPRHTTVSWETVPAAASYTVEVDFRDPPGWSQTILKQGITVSNFSFDFVGKQRGRVKVCAIGANGGNSECSAWREFEYTI